MCNEIGSRVKLQSTFVDFPSISFGASGTIVFHSFLGQSVRANVETGSGVVLVVDVPTTDWLDRGLSIGDRVVWRIRPGRALPTRRTRSPAAPR